jgi:glyoxylase-like metal-dependent hydrolase (beta-lactamase superfamily II)
MVTLAVVLAGSAYAQELQIDDIGWGFTSVYAVHESGGRAVVLVDAQNPGREERILRRLEAAGFERGDVRALVLTHAHPDHAGSAAALARALDVPVIGGSADTERFSTGEAPLHPTGLQGRLVSLVVSHRFPPVALDVGVDPGQSLDLGAYGLTGAAVTALGGHTPGSLVVSLDAGREVIVGDLIRSRIGRHRVPALHFFHDDEAAAHRALATVAAGATTVYPIHGGPLDAADVRDWLARHDVELPPVATAAAAAVAGP